MLRKENIPASPSRQSKCLAGAAAVGTGGGGDGAKAKPLLSFSRDILPAKDRKESKEPEFGFC